MIAELLNDLRREEGWRASPYFDSEGFLTIGYGFLIDKRKSVKMPRAVGEMWLKLLVEDKLNELYEKLPWILDQPADVQRALGNMCYQIGISGVLKFKRMLAALKAGDRLTAAEEALESEWFEQTPERAKRVADLLRGAA